jgi:hypothetical protein
MLVLKWIVVFIAGRGLDYNEFFRGLPYRKIKRSFLNEEEQSVVYIFLDNLVYYYIHAYEFCQTGRAGSRT